MVPRNNSQNNIHNTGLFSKTSKTNIVQRSLVHANMNYDQANTLLQEKLTQRQLLDPTFKSAVWLIRESATQTGMLSVNFLKWDNVTKSYKKGAYRYALVNKKIKNRVVTVWGDAVSEKDIKTAYTTMLRALSANNVKSNILKSLIAKLKMNELYISNLLYPPQSQATQHSLYTCFYRKYLPISSKMLQALSSPRTLSLMQDPVTIICTLTPEEQKQYLHVIQANYGDQSPLYHILSDLFTQPELNTFDRSELKALNVPSNDFSLPFQFIPNRCVKDIVAVVSNKAFSIYDQLQKIDDLICCPITLAVMQDPALTPSGHTYEKTHIYQSIEIKSQDPMTREPLKTTDITNNYSLRAFISAYKQYEIKSNKIIDSNDSDDSDQESSEEENNHTSKKIKM